jgi:ribosomal protein S18 acetylase RimI-like enzyme
MSALQSLIAERKVPDDAFRAGKTDTQKYVLDLHGKGLTELPIDDPDYPRLKVLILRDNKLTALDLSKLPRNLIALDVRSNDIREFTGMDGIPKTLTTIHFDNNLIKEHPPFPESVNFVSSAGNPFKPKDLFRDILEGLPERAIVWFHKEGIFEGPFFTEEDKENSSYILKVYDEETMRKFMGFADTFIKETICHSKLSGTYISSKVVTASNLLVEVVGGEVVAVAIFKFKGDKREIHVDVLCSAAKNRGGGSRLIKILVDYMNSHGGMDTIILESLSSARGFYEKMGFKRCVEGDLCPMELRRGTTSGGGTRRRRRA